MEDDPSDKIEDTLTERAVIHGAVKKIDNVEGEDLIDSFINESEPTQPTNSWLSTNVEGNTDTSTASSTGTTATTTLQQNSENTQTSADNDKDPLFLTKE